MILCQEGEKPSGKGLVSHPVSIEVELWRYGITRNPPGNRKSGSGNSIPKELVLPRREKGCEVKR